MLFRLQKESQAITLILRMCIKHKIILSCSSFIFYHLVGKYYTKNMSDGEGAADTYYGNTIVV